MNRVGAGRRRRLAPVWSLPGIALGCVLFFAGCGLAQLQTARTVPAGAWRTTVAAGVAYNNLVGERGVQFPLASSLVEVSVRRGLTANVDTGLRTFFGLGLLADAKWNLLPVDGPAALAVAMGVAGAADPLNERGAVWTAHVPLTVLGSYDVTRAVTPYAAIGYRAFWIFNYGETAEMPGVRYAARSGTGDGVLLAQAGLQLASVSGRAVLLEYGYARPIVDDPGDHYSFVATHLLSIGFRFRSGAPAR